MWLFRNLARLRLLVANLNNRRYVLLLRNMLVNSALMLPIQQVPQVRIRHLRRPCSARITQSREMHFEHADQWGRSGLLIQK